MTFQISGFVEVCNACCCVGSANRHRLSFSGRASNTCCVGTRCQKTGRFIKCSFPRSRGYIGFQISPGVQPSEFVAVPRMTARIGSPSRKAASRRFRTTQLMASDLQYPSALASNVWHLPDAEDAVRMAPMSMFWSGLMYRLAPATMAPSTWPVWMYLQATSTETKLPEHAVSIVILFICQRSNPRISSSWLYLAPLMLRK
jgi:hypothetical protein